MGDSEIVKCPTCGMTWFTRRLCGSCAFKSEPDPDCETCGGHVEYGLTDAHECPEPFPYETAKAMLDAAAATRGGIFTDQRAIARVKLGLAQGPETA